MSALDLTTFDGPLTAVAINEWLNKCEMRFKVYNEDNPGRKLSQIQLVDRAGLKIKDEGVTHDLSDWFANTGDFKSWNDFKARLKDQALGAHWLAHAVEALFTAKQEERTIDAYIRDLEENRSILKHSDQATNLQISDHVYKYLMLFNARSSVTADIMDSGLDIVKASVIDIRESIRKAS